MGRSRFDEFGFEPLVAVPSEQVVDRFAAVAIRRVPTFDQNAAGSHIQHPPAGLRDVVSVEPVSGGLAALAGTATRRNAPPVFVKALADAPDDDVFAAEAEGLAALRELGAVATPEVILANREVLVLSVLRPRPSIRATSDTPSCSAPPPA